MLVFPAEADKFIDIRKTFEGRAAWKNPVTFFVQNQTSFNSVSDPITFALIYAFRCWHNKLQMILPFVW